MSGDGDFLRSALDQIDQAQRIIQTTSGPELALSLSYKLDQIKAEVRRAQAAGKYARPDHWPRDAWESLIERYLTDEPNQAGKRVALFILTDDEQGALEAHRG